jgi:penicillin amidase
MRRILAVALVCVLLPTVAAAQSLRAGPPVTLPGSQDEAQITREANGIAHIKGENEHDLYFLQGFVHAQDRLFQMDFRRRQASGTLAELLGPAALGSDVLLRTIGLRRAAKRSAAAISPRTRAALEAYADGVNAFVSTNTNALPPEYAALELSHFEQWTPLDSVTVAKLISFGRSFDLMDIENTVNLLTYQQAGALLGFDGAKLFFEDLFRSAPFDSASTVPDASLVSVAVRARRGRDEDRAAESRASMIDRRTLEFGKEYLDKAKQVPLLRRILERHRHGGSNEWAVSGAHTTSGRPLLANDIHLDLDVPSTFYPIHLQAGAVDVIGGSFAGAPFVIAGHNRNISWGATTHFMDVTDTFREHVVPDPTSPSGLSIVHKGQLEPIILIPEVFRQNKPGNGIPDDVTPVPSGGPIPPATLVVPRRNNGPIIMLDLAGGTALSVQYTGFSATRELDTFLIWNEARNLDDFIRGLQFFDVGSINWAYSDVRGNIAYFSSGELPVREDLQAGTVSGLRPFFIRNGTGGNEWLSVQHLQPGQAVPFEILPFDEMPHIINPPAGFFVNANNDPAGVTLDNDPLNQLRPGGGIYYLSPLYDAGFRAGRITRLIKEKLSTGYGKLSFENMQEIQADTVMPDAQVFVPHILQAFANAQAPGADPALAALAADPAVAEAVGRLRGWDFTTPTGIPEGFDASDPDQDGNLQTPSPKEIASSVAATLYSVWRGQFIRNTIDAALTPFGLPVPDSQQALTALRHLLDAGRRAEVPIFNDNFSGVGASGVNFFNVPGVANAADRRDVLILQSLADALKRLAGEPFAAAFGGSTNQDDYRWGKLHRIVLDHPLGGPFSIPPAGGAFSPPLAGLPGIPTDGGFDTVDAATHDARADSVDAFMFGSGPNDRFVSEAGPGRVRAESSLPGEVSGALGSPFYANLLPAWLTNNAFPLLLRNEDIEKNAASVTKFAPAELTTFSPSE